MAKEITVQTTDQAELDRTDMIRDSLKSLGALQATGLKGFSKLAHLADEKQKPLIIRGSAYPLFEALTDVSGVLEWDENYLQEDLYKEYIILNGYRPIEGKEWYHVRDVKGKDIDLRYEADVQYLFYRADRIEAYLNKLLATTSTKAIGDLHDDDLARKPTTPKSKGEAVGRMIEEEGHNGSDQE